MTQDELDERIKLHELWLKYDWDKGQKLILENKSLQGLTFVSHDLRWAQFYKCNMSDCNFTMVPLVYTQFVQCNLDNAIFSLANLERATMSGCSAKCVNFTGADFHLVNMNESDFTGANFDSASFPLWCGGSKFKVDDKFVTQILAHLCSLEVSPKARAELDKVLDFAKTSHYAKDLGILDEE